MSRAEWLTFAREHADVLRKLINEYHPASANELPMEVRDEMLYSAPGAEMACRVVREYIRSNWGVQGSPVHRFTEALQRGDVDMIGKLLDQTWFGVPECTSAWQITGFAEAVELLDDPPDDTIDVEGSDASR